MQTQQPEYITSAQTERENKLEEVNVAQEYDILITFVHYHTGDQMDESCNNHSAVQAFARKLIMHGIKELEQLVSGSTVLNIITTMT